MGRAAIVRLADNEYFGGMLLPTTRLQSLKVSVGMPAGGERTAVPPLLVTESHSLSCGSGMSCSDHRSLAILSSNSLLVRYLALY